MSAPLGPDTDEQWRKEIERRLLELETSQRAAFTSIIDDDGNELVRTDRTGIRVFDNTGQLRAFIGNFDGAGNYAFAVWDGDGGLRSMVDNDGHKDPWLHSAFVPDPAVTLVGQRAESVSATFQNVWESRFQLVTHKGLAADVLVGADVGTAGEVRVLGPDGNTNAIAVTSAGGLASFRWLHTSPLGTGPALFKIQMRRTSGAGKVYSWWPTAAAMADPDSCDADGV